MKIPEFEIAKSDNKIIRFIKSEAEYDISESTDDAVREQLKTYFIALINFCKSCSKDDGEEILAHRLSALKDKIPDILNFVPTKKIILDDLDFIRVSDNRSVHKIACNIEKYNGNPSYYINNNAYKLKVKKIFDFATSEVLEQFETANQDTVFISKGGVINGEHLSLCELIYSEEYRVKPPIDLPVAKVYFKNGDNVYHMIYVVDHREPALKWLQENYNVKTLIDTFVRDNKLNLRECKNSTEKKQKADFYKNTEFVEPIAEIKGDYACVWIRQDYFKLNMKYGTIAEWVNGQLTIYWSVAKYKKIKNYIWKTFTGYSIDVLKRMYKYGNPNITFK